MKTFVRVTSDVNNGQAKKGDIGYIDGYVRGADDVPYAIVVILDLLSFVPLNKLEVIGQKG